MIIRLLIFVVLFCLPESLYADVIYPISDKNEIVSLIAQLNKQGLVRDKFLDFNAEMNGIFFKDLFNVSRTIYKVDINNDGADEYVMTSTGGSGQFFDIEAIYKQKQGEFKDIFDQIKLPLRKSQRDLDGEHYDLEEGYVGIMHGAIIIEEENNRVYFTMVDSSGQWWVPDDDLAGGGQWVEENCPMVRRYLWDAKGLQFIKANQRCLKESDFIRNNQTRQ